MVHLILIDVTKSSILTLLICIIITTIPLDIFSEVENLNYNQNDLIYEITDKPFNRTYSDWTAKWWQWAYSIPKDHHPAYDNTGEFCSEKQKDPVWFFPGTFGHPVTRYCNIQAGNAILFPILNSECSYIEFPQLKNERELRDCAKIIQDKVINLSASIDNNELKNLEEYRIQSSLFNFSLPQNNILGLPPQKTQAVSDGNWVFLKPLSIGQHEIKFKGEVNKTIGASDSNFAGPIGWDYQTTYIVTIK